MLKLEAQGWQWPQDSPNILLQNIPLKLKCLGMGMPVKQSLNVTEFIAF